MIPTTYYLVKLRCFVPETRTDRPSTLRAKYAFYYVQANGEGFQPAQSAVSALLSLVNADWSGSQFHQWDAQYWTRSNIAVVPYSSYYQANLPLVA